MGRGNLFRMAATLALAAMLLAAVGAYALHPWLHAHGGKTPAAEQTHSTLCALARQARHNECPVCKFQAAFHAAPPDDAPCAAACAMVRTLCALPASPLAQRIPCLPLGARAPPL